MEPSSNQSIILAQNKNILYKAHKLVYLYMIVLCLLLGQNGDKRGR